MNRKVLAEKTMNFVILETVGMIVCLGFGLLMLYLYIVDGGR
ncbi:MAG: hypothetical protein K0Q49_1743 [Haloplasmataceae bacterium]|jgi:hypothetical protein|nr:hypothetical protein [Haloplasmataceae bacterium]